MGWSNSKESTANQELTENGSVNANFVVQETKVQMSSDIKIMFYIICLIMILSFMLKAVKHTPGISKGRR